jgi:hypothetical protein
MHQATATPCPLLVTPIEEAASKVVAIEVQQLANVVERERPEIVVEADPCLSIHVKLTSLGVTRVNVFLKTLNRVLNDRNEEPVLAAREALAL